MRRLHFAVLFTAAAGVAAAAPAVAQQTVARLYVVKSMPGHATQFERAFTEHVAFRKQHNDPWSWSVAQVVAGDDLGQWYIRSGGHRWADLDAYETSDFARRALQHWLTNVAPHVQHVASMVTTTDTTNIRWPEDQSAIRFINLVDWRVQAENFPALFEMIGKYHEAIVQTNHPVYYSFSLAVAGGSGPTIRLVLPYESWADMAPPEQSMQAMIAEVYGEEEGRELQQRFNSMILSSTSTLLMIRPDLSIGMGM